MVKIGAMIVVGVIIATMAAGMYTYTQYQTNYITSVAGDPRSNQRKGQA